MSTSRVRRPLTAAAAATLALGLTACGSSGSQGAAGHQSGAGQHTQGMAALKPGQSVRPQRLFTPGLMPMRSARSVHLQMHATMMGVTQVGSGDMSMTRGQVPDMDLTMKANGRTMRMIMADHGIYMKGIVPGGKYLRLDQRVPMLKQLMTSMSNIDPQKTMAAMKQAVRQVRYLGKAKVNGTQTRHYRVTVDVVKSVKAMLSSNPALRDQVLAGLRSHGGPRTASSEIYQAPDGRLSRMVSQQMGGTTTMDFSRWGEPVHVQAPPASQVTSKMPGMPGMAKMHDGMGGQAQS